jgi:tetratricopeptide (TPR) repeat protein
MERRQTWGAQGAALVPLEVPPWLTDAVAPWRVVAAFAWRHGGVALVLASSRARVPVLVEQGHETTSVRLLDPRTSPGPGRALVHAVQQRLRAVDSLDVWLTAIATLREIFLGAAPTSSPEADAMRVLWQAWPARVRDPGSSITALPDIDPDVRLDRTTRAALVHHCFARGETLRALACWHALGELPRDAGFVEAHVHALALATVGRRHEALDSIARAEAVADEPAQCLACANLRELLDDRAGAIAVHERIVAGSDDLWDHLRHARVCGGDAVTRLCTPRRLADIGGRTSLAFAMVKLLEETGEYDAAIDVLEATIGGAHEPARVALARRAASLHLWRLDIERTRTHVTALPEGDPQRLEIEGALEVLAGRARSGLRRLEASCAHGETRVEALLWQAHAHLALDQPTRALACVHEALLVENSLAAFLLKAVALAGADPEELRQGLRSPTFLEALVDDVLPSLVEPARISAALEDPHRFAELAAEVLVDMGGNRSSRPTWCRTDASGARRLERIELPATGREAAVENLVRIRGEQPSVVLAAFAAVAQRYPRSPHPFTYAGELLIWLGSYAEALDAFTEADARAPTRWSFVGRAAVHGLLGRSDEAERWSKAGVAKFGSLASATIHGYRGEWLRRAGELEAAREELELAVRYRARRIGARTNLALVLHAMGDEAGWTRETGRLSLDAPAYLWEAGVRPDEPIDPASLETALRLMAGNRSSFVHTMVDAKGSFRVVPDPRPLRDHARLTLGLARPSLAIALRDAHLRG